MILYDNYNLCLYYDQAKRKNKQLTDDQIWGCINAQDQFCWDGMMAIIQDYEKAHSIHYWIAMGISEQWYGKCHGGIICSSFEELLQKVGRDCDYFCIKVDQYGRLSIRCAHHDGTNNIQVKALTDAGASLWGAYTNSYCSHYAWANPKRYRAKYDNYTEEQMHKVLWDSKTYSKNYGKII